MCNVIKVAMVIISLLFGAMVFAQEEIPEVAIELEVEAEREKPAEVALIKPEEVEKMVHIESYGDAIARLPGSQNLIGCLMNSPRPSFRGSVYTDLQVLIEGIPVNPIGSCTLNRIPFSAVSELEVVKGPAPPKYPANTLAGIVSMRLKTGDQYPGGLISTTLGSYNNQVYEFSAGGGDEHNNYFIAYNRTNWDGWMPKKHITNLSDIAFKWVSALGEDSNLIVAGDYLMGEKQGFRARGPNPYDAWEHRWPNLARPAGSITYTRKISPKSDIFLRIAPVSLTYDLQFQKWDAKTQKEVPMLTLRRYKLLRGEFEQTIKVKPLNLVTWGLWWQKDEDRQTTPSPAPTVGAWFTRELTSRGLYIQNTFSPAENSMWTLGLRYDDTAPGKPVTVPFVSLHRRLDETTGLRFAVTRNKRFPRLDELYGVGINIGNPNLKPESCWNYEADWERLLLPGSKLSLTIFRADHTDRIGVDPNYVYQNIGKARIQGVELSYESKIKNGSWWANYAFIDAKDLTLNRPFIPAYRTGPPKHMAKAGVSLEAKNQMTYNFEALYYGARPTDVAQPTWVGAPWNVWVPTEVPSYFILNFKLTRPLGNERAFSLSIENLLNKDYEEIVFYRKPGRWLNFSLSQKF